MPENEKRGRVQTSTITVAVLPELEEKDLRVSPNDVVERTFKGGGPGGQHRNKTESGVEVTHKPTGIQARSANLKSQHANRRAAWGMLRVRLLEARAGQQHADHNATRKDQVGSGMRGDKVRTIRVQDGVVTDHRLERKIPLRDYLRGDWGKLLG